MRKSRELNVPVCKGNTAASALFRNEPCCRLRIFEGTFGKGIYKAVCYGNALPSDCPVDKVLFGMHHVYQVDDALWCHAADRYFDLCFRFFHLCFLYLFCHVILEKQKRERPYRERPVALAVPINLRAWFPSETLRNFITTVRPYIDPALGDYTFPEIVSQVRHFMKLHINRQELQAAFTGNVRFTKNFALRLVPVVLKNPVMALNYRLHGVRPYSCTYTNPGAFTVPREMAAYIRGAEVILGQATVPRCHCASISYGDTMEITFAGTQAETDTERDFFRFLVRAGIPVRVESNR